MNQKSVILFASMLCLLLSCSQESETIYSCDKTINEWAKSNLEDIQTMTRSNWLALPDNKKNAAYRAFTPSQKINFWYEKLEEIKSCEWTEDELSHINKVIYFIDSHHDIFSGGALSDVQEDELDKFFYLWTNYAIEDLGWTIETCIAIAGTGKQIPSPKRGPYPFVDGPSEKKDCHCNTGILSDFCGSAGPCFSGNCEELSDGCGWFLRQKCDGRCYHAAIVN